MTMTVSRSDADLKTAVVDELEWTPSIDSTHIGVSVDTGAVTLSGEVRTYPEKVLAAKAVQRVHGVTAIAQEITVRSGWTTTDSDIAREAGQALERVVDVPDSVKVVVHDQAVTLSGVVEWHYQHDAAERAVRHIKGVTGVVNAITIRPATSGVATGAKASITSALVRHARLESKRITVTTDVVGVATIEGAVRSWSERHEAEQACWAAPGVMDVVNRLRIEY
jgi:osmotically-inducible protein OsmY